MNRVDLADGASLEWQKRLASFIVDEESKLPAKKLIAQNFYNIPYPVVDLKTTALASCTFTMLTLKQFPSITAL